MNSNVICLHKLSMRLYGKKLERNLFDLFCGAEVKSPFFPPGWVGEVEMTQSTESVPHFLILDSSRRRRSDTIQTSYELTFLISTNHLELQSSRKWNMDKSWQLLALLERKATVALLLPHIPFLILCFYFYFLILCHTFPSSYCAPIIVHIVHFLILCPDQ